MSPDPDPPRRTAPRGAALPPACEIVLQNPRRYPEAAARRLRPWLSSLVADLAPGAASFAVRFVSDREMRRWNHGWRGKDRATDVLSFPGDVGDPAKTSAAAERHLGDVLVAVPTARRQAVAGGHGVERELKTLLLHGVLHCLGHDHETDGGTMARLEARLSRRWLADA